MVGITNHNDHTQQLYDGRSPAPYPNLLLC